MAMKEDMAIGIGLVILVVAAGIAYQNHEYAKLAGNQVNTLNSIIQQNNNQIIRLSKEIKAKQDALISVKAELDTTKKALNDANTKINVVIQQAATR
jgi:signal transduction histidine kinase